MTSIGAQPGRTEDPTTNEPSGVVPGPGSEEIGLGLDVPGIGRAGLWYRTRRVFGRTVVAAVAISLVSLPPVLMIAAAPGQAVLVLAGWFAICIALILLARADRDDGGGAA